MEENYLSAYFVCSSIAIAYILFRSRQYNKSKIVHDSIQQRLDNIDKHLEASEQMLKCYDDTLDPDFIAYSNEELSKASELIEMNKKD